MCRLLGFATAGSNTTLNGVLGMQTVREFRNLSEIHNDGWGAALVTVPEESPYRRDGGAPTPETGTAIYKNTVAARHDPIFDELANTPARGGLWHLRLASSNLPLILENQQPFFANGLSFIHNGDISDDQGRNIITNRSFPVDPSLVQSTGGRSDSAMFFRGHPAVPRFRLRARRGGGPGRARAAQKLSEVQLQLHDPKPGPVHRSVRGRS